MPTATTTYAFQKPTVGGDSDVWGGHVNDMMDKVDDLLDGTLPITPATGALLEIRKTEAATNTVTDALRINAQSSGTPAAGIGVGLEFAAETGVGNTEIGAIIEAVTTDVTAASEDFDLVIKTMAAGAAAAERVRIGSAGLTIGGAAAVTESGAQTLTNKSIDAGQLTGDVAAARITTALNASGSAPIYACRAWVNFNGTGTVAIRASGNVTSITDNGTGNYTVNFTTSMPDANYSAVATGALNSTTMGVACPVAYLAASVRVITSQAGSGNILAATLNDHEFINVSVFR